MVWVWVLLSYAASVGLNMLLLAVMPRDFSLGPDGSRIDIPGAIAVAILSAPAIIITPFIIRANLKLWVRRQTYYPDYI